MGILACYPPPSDIFGEQKKYIATFKEMSGYWRSEFSAPSELGLDEKIKLAKTPFIDHGNAFFVLISIEKSKESIPNEFAKENEKIPRPIKPSDIYDDTQLKELISSKYSKGFEDGFKTAKGVMKKLIKDNL